ncbi:MAG: hypothetical protein K6G38_01000 [Gammaproteobacteria bacterium]|nr:hypothetical protein [Gammaproteobacteria bacterium]
MKKINGFILVIIALLVLVGCAKSTTKEASTTLELKVATPSSAPAIAFYNHLLESNLEINSKANNVIAYLSSNSDKDVVVAPTDKGISAINQGADYKIAATITFGNFYIVSTGNDSDKTLSEGDSVLAFQENSIAGMLFKYVYGDLNLNVTYLSDLGDVKNDVLASNETSYDYILLAQPVAQAILSQRSNFKIFKDVQEDYKTKSNGLEITQASIFVRSSLDSLVVERFLNMIENDINSALADISVFNDAVSDVSDELFASKLGGNKTLIPTLLSKGMLGLGFKRAFDNKESIDNFIKTLGLSETNEEIYYVSQK